ncbi:MAG TPA: hypothetical protein VFE72_00390 [Lysobacter sp.]|nr:hypothetical protein [Lysobacter sp.]
MTMDMHDPATRWRGRWSMAIWATAAALLLVPAVAMRFDTGVNWTASDFVAMGLLLTAACGAFELAARLSGGWLARAAFAVAVLGGFALVWVNLAVGLVGDGANPANAMFMGVPPVAAIATLLARFRPAAMVRAMLATAALHALVGAVAIVGGWGQPVNGPLHTAGVTLFFMVPWLLSALLFRLAARR